VSEWLAAFEADVAADMAVTEGTKATKAPPEIPFVTIVAIVPRVSAVCVVPPPPEWAYALTGLEARARPDSIPAERWAQAVADAGYLVRELGAAPDRCGWTLADIFSAHRERPLARYDCMGLVLLLEGRKIGPIDQDQIAIRQPGGNSLRFRIRQMPTSETMMLWDLP
jgi:hypothetical protein